MVYAMMKRRGGMTILTTTSVGALLLALTACDKTPDPAASGASGAVAPTGAPSLVAPGGLPAGHPPTGDAPGAAMVGDSPSPAGGLVWEAPDAWEKIDHPSSMRKATYRIKRVEGDTEDAEMSVTQVGGGVDANITRWEGQFKKKEGETKRETKKVGGFDVTIVEIRGTIAGGGMPGARAEERAGQAMLAAIVMTPSAPHFFKMTGPEKTVTAARGDFDTFVGTFRKR